MKKHAMVILAAVACAAAFADGVAPTYDAWFTGIGDAPTAGDLKPTNAAWDLSTGVTTSGSSVDVADGKLNLLLEGSDFVTLTPTADKAPDTNTVTKVALSVALSGVDALPTFGADGDNPQFAVVVYTNAYNVWNGAEWVELGGTPTDDEVALDVEISYQDMDAVSPVRTATFSIGGAELGTVTLAGEAQACDGLTKVACAGSAVIGQVSSTVMRGVAQNNGTKYGTVEAAVTAASAVGAPDNTVVVLLDTDETIEVASSVKIDTNGKETGAVTPEDGSNLTVTYGGEGSTETTESTTGAEIVVNTTVDDANKIDVDVEDDSKEATNKVMTDLGEGNKKKLIFDIQTKASILAAVTPTGAKTLSASESKMRAFLSENKIASYTQANTSAKEIADDMDEAGANTLPLWKSYVMGIKPTDSIAPVSSPAGDTSSTGIRLSIPALATATPSGDYTVTYKVMEGDTQRGEFDGASGIELPLATGTYKVRASFK